MKARDGRAEFARALLPGYDFDMSLTEIETAAERLSVPEQEELLRHLERLLRSKHRPDGAESRGDWMQRLNSLRAAIGSGTSTVSGAQILAELRED